MNLPQLPGQGGPGRQKRGRHSPCHSTQLPGRGVEVPDVHVAPLSPAVSDICSFPLLLPSLGLVLPPYSTFYLQANLSDQILQVKCKWPGPCLRPAPLPLPRTLAGPRQQSQSLVARQPLLPSLPTPQAPAGWGTSHPKVCGNLHARLFSDLVPDHSLMISVEVFDFSFSYCVSSLLSLPPPRTPLGAAFLEDTPSSHLSSPQRPVALSPCRAPLPGSLSPLLHPPNPPSLSSSLSRPLTFL